MRRCRRSYAAGRGPHRACGAGTCSGTGSRSRHASGRCCTLLTLAFLAACTGPQHALVTRGPAAARIEDLWWVMLALATAVCVAVAILLGLAIRSSQRRVAGGPARDVNGRVLVIAGGVAIPAVIIFTVLIYSYRVGAEIYPRGDETDALVIEVVGHQFWWEVRYPEFGIVTANEIHLPAGRPVLFRLSAPDVIHSFWIPQLHGKMDMIPGQIHTLRVVAEEPGRFRGQCAEFCGDGHALMALWAEAHDPDAFEEWVDARRSAVETERLGTRTHDPAGAGVRASAADRGRDVFFSAGCGDCHATRGAPLSSVQGETAPDLSDLAIRSTLAAATIPNTRETLRAWILAPDAIKPGNLMPGTLLPRDELEALLDYLETLR